MKRKADCGGKRRGVRLMRILIRKKVVESNRPSYTDRGLVLGGGYDE